MKSLFVLAVITLSFSKHSTSQNDPQYLRSGWGLETEFVQPFYPTVHIFRIQATKTIFDLGPKSHADLILGAYIRPNVKHDVVEKINEYMFAIGIRYFPFRGLHVEAKSNMGYAWGTKNLVDGKDYETPTWFWEANLGYKIDFYKKTKINFYVTPQIGGLGKIIADIGPRGGKPDIFLHGNLFLGINF